MLEESTGQKLFKRSGRQLVLTEVGQATYRYAEEIFGLGQELLDMLKGRPAGHPSRLRVGIADIVPKLVARKILEPCLSLDEPIHLICREGKQRQLLADLAIHSVDVVLADSPVGPDTSVRAYNHLLGECGITVVGSPKLARKYRVNFPKSLDGAPILLPTANTALRRSLDLHFRELGIQPVILAEFEDSALLKVFGQTGLGLFAVADVVAQDVCRQYRVARVGDLPSIVERFYAITVERKLVHPGVAAISSKARRELFR
jgi:LysR family transcriptional activator of nhaA